MELNSDKDLMELIAKVKEGDDDAFAILVEQYRPMFNSVLKSYDLDERDAFSELCFAFHKSVLKYELDLGTTFGLYAKICLQNKARDLLRRRESAFSYILDSDVDVENIAVSGGVQSILEHRERSAYFLSVAKKVLSKMELEVYRYWMLGYKTAEIASALGITAKKVDNTKNRMWKKLRSHLTPED